MIYSTLTRRTFIVSSTAVAGSLLLNSPASAEPPETDSSVWTDSVSANGWPISVPGKFKRIEGTLVSVPYVDGDAGDILTYAVRRFHYEVKELDPQLVTGHHAHRAVDAQYLSNGLSGTAIDVLGLSAPLGSVGIFSGDEIDVIRDILWRCRGTLAWAADMKCPSEGYFQIDVAPGSRLLAVVAEGIRFGTQNELPGSVDALEVGRRREAAAFTKSVRKNRSR